jgi:hypothetical protein
MEETEQTHGNQNTAARYRFGRPVAEAASQHRAQCYNLWDEQLSFALDQL